MRPFLREFLEAVVLWFDVAVWSSGSDPYVHAIAERIFPSTAVLQFVWSRDRCTQRFDPEKQDHYWAKNLEKVKRKGFTLARVLVIDDSPEALADHYGNHLKLQRFEGQANDSELRDVLPFLKWLSGIENLRSVEKRRWREFVPGSESTSPPQGRHVDIRKRNIP